MDFFGILFDMKNGKKIPYSKNYFDTLFAENLAGVTTLTGTLPLTFTTSETALRSWTIFGNNYEHKYGTSGTLPLTFTTHTAGNADDWSISGNNNIGKNLFQIIPADQVITETGTLTFVTDAESGTITANGTAGSTESNVKQRFTVTSELAGNYYYSGNFNQTGSLSTFDAYMYDNTARGFITKWDGTTRAPTIKGTESQEVKLIEGHRVELTIRVFANESVNGLVFKPMLRPADTSADFEPYQVGVGQRTKNLLEDEWRQGNAQSLITESRCCATSVIPTVVGDTFSFGLYNDTKRYAIYGINAAGLAEFNQTQTVSNANRIYNSGFMTENMTVTTEDTNIVAYWVMLAQIESASSSTIVPDDCRSCIVMVRGTDLPQSYIPYGYEVPLTINTTTQDIYIGSAPLTAGETVSKTSTGVDIAAIAGSNTVTTELYNKPSMAIEGVDYVGVGEPRGQGYSIALQCVGELSPYNPNAPESNTSYVYNATNFTLDTDARYRTALIDLGRKNQIKIFTIGKTKGETYKIQAIDYMGEWGGVDHYSQIGQTITPTEPTYTGSTAAQYLLVTYYDSEIDTLSPQEIRESITVSATVDTHTFIPIDAPLTEGQTVSKESTGVDIETFPNAVNSLRYTTDYSDFEMSITYKGG